MRPVHTRWLLPRTRCTPLALTREVCSALSDVYHAAGQNKFKYHLRHIPKGRLTVMGFHLGR